MLFAALTLAGPAFGADGTGDGAEHVVRDRARDDVAVNGTVERIALEGGFWGVVGDDGTRYDVVNLPKEFRKQGLRIRFVGRVRPDQVSFHMWGVIVEAISVEKLGATGK